MKTVFIGWGSLLWRPGSLSVSSDWRPEGPVLPIEFSRISSDGRLTLIVDPVHGRQVRTLYAETTLDLSAAVENLAEREGTTGRWIGWWDARSGRSSGEEHPDQADTCATVARWARSAGVAAAVWTALPATFRERTGGPFSIDAALDYLETLEGDVRHRALEYIRKAPPTTRTDLREAFDERFGSG